MLKHEIRVLERNAIGYHLSDLTNLACNYNVSFSQITQTADRARSRSATRVRVLPATTRLLRQSVDVGRPACALPAVDRQFLQQPAAV